MIKYKCTNPECEDYNKEEILDFETYNNKDKDEQTKFIIGDHRRCLKCNKVRWQEIYGNKPAFIMKGYELAKSIKRIK